LAGKSDFSWKAIEVEIDKNLIPLELNLVKSFLIPLLTKKCVLSKESKLNLVRFQSWILS